MSSSLRTICSKNITIYILIIICPTKSIMCNNITFISFFYFLKSFLKFFKIIFIFTIYNFNNIIIRNMRTNCITYRTESISSNTKCFKFSTTHYIFLISSLVKKVIRTSSFTNFFNYWIHNFITSCNNTLKVRTRKVLFKRFISSQNMNHIIKKSIITSFTTIFISKIFIFTKFFTTLKTIFSSYIIKSSSFVNSFFNSFLKFSLCFTIKLRFYIIIITFSS